MGSSMVSIRAQPHLPYRTRKSRSGRTTHYSDTPGPFKTKRPWQLQVFASSYVWSDVSLDDDQLHGRRAAHVGTTQHGRSASKLEQNSVAVARLPKVQLSKQPALSEAEKRVSTARSLWLDNVELEAAPPRSSSELKPAYRWDDFRGYVRQRTPTELRLTHAARACASAPLPSIHPTIPCLASADPSPVAGPRTGFNCKPVRITKAVRLPTEESSTEESCSDSTHMRHRDPRLVVPDFKARGWAPITSDLRGNSLAETSESYERWRRIVHHRRQPPQLFSFLDTKKSRVERSVNASELRLLPRDVRSAIASAWASQQALNGDEAAAVPNEVTELDEDFKHYMHYSREFRRVWAKDMIDRCTNKNEANLELYRQWKREMIETRVIAPMPFMKEPPQLKKQLTSKLKPS